MQVLVTDLKIDEHGLGVCVSLKHRHNQWERTLWVPWKWLAVSQVDERLEREYVRTSRRRQGGQQPSLPLEKWE